MCVVIAVIFIFYIQKHIVRRILRGCRFLIITDGVALPVPELDIHAPAFLFSDGIRKIHAVFFEKEFIRFQHLKHPCKRRRSATRNFVFEADIMVPNVTVLCGRSDCVVQIEDMISKRRNIFRNGVPRLIRYTIEAETITNIFAENVDYLVNWEGIADVDFHHIAVGEITGGGEHSDDAWRTQMKRRDCRHHIGQTITATVLHMERPISTGQAVYGVVILIIVGSLRSAVVLPIVEYDGAEGIAIGIIPNGHCIGELSVKDTQLHPSDVLTGDGIEGSCIIPFEPRVERHNRRSGFLVGGGDSQNSLRVNPGKTADTIRQETLHTHDIRTVINGQRVNSTGIIPTCVVCRI